MVDQVQTYPSRVNILATGATGLWPSDYMRHLNAVELGNRAYNYKWLRGCTSTGIDSYCFHLTASQSKTHHGSCNILPRQLQLGYQPLGQPGGRKDCTEHSRQRHRIPQANKRRQMLSGVFNLLRFTDQFRNSINLTFKNKFLYKTDISWSLPELVSKPEQIVPSNNNSRDTSFPTPSTQHPPPSPLSSNPQSPSPQIQNSDTIAFPAPWPQQPSSTPTHQPFPRPTVASSSQLLYVGMLVT